MFNLQKGRIANRKAEEVKASPPRFLDLVRSNGHPDVKKVLTTPQTVKKFTLPENNPTRIPAGTYAIPPAKLDAYLSEAKGAMMIFSIALLFFGTLSLIPIINMMLVEGLTMWVWIIVLAMICLVVGGMLFALSPKGKKLLKVLETQLERVDATQV